jgi:ADP-ribosyl-[dinitrogen reductase] hydrolase
VGTTVEFKERGDFVPLTDMVGGGPFRLKAGQWTDDTSMALCLGASLRDCDPFDPEDLLSAFCDWMDHGYMSVTGRCFDIGTTTREALQAFQNKNQLVAPDHPFLSGNGSIMRLSPAVIRHHNNLEEATSTSIQQGITTHGSAECQASCEKLAGILYRAINGEDPALDKSLIGKDPLAIRSSGYVMHTMEAAQWAVVNTDNFADAILMAANLGDDADTTAAVAGQIAGAMHGLAGIREDWLERLEWRDDILELIDRLYDLGDVSVIDTSTN